MPAQSRQLAAIMFTDIVGYTALMGKDSAKALELIRISKEIQKPLVEKHHGQWLKEMGDGALAKFGTALDAVNCSKEIQEIARGKLDAKLRIGLHLGDITVENDDVYGDGVNVASRLESIADPGGIYISESIEKAIQGQTDVQAKYLGEVKLKNVAYGVRTYAVQGVGLPLPEIKDGKELSGHLWAEVQRRGVIRAAIAYVVVGLLLVLLLREIQNWVTLPGWSLTAVVTSLLVSFPVAMYLAWNYERSPEGFVRTSSRESWQNPYSRAKRKPLTSSFVIAGLLLVIVAMYVYPRFLANTGVSDEIIVDDKSIAVLPFKNMSGDPEQEALCDGLTEEIIHHLTLIKSFDKVISRSSAMSFKNSDKTLPEIAGLLKVNIVLEGSFRQSGDQIKISAQLIDAINDNNLWSEIYERPFGDIFDIQSEIAKNIAAKFKAEITLEEEIRLDKKPTESSEAYILLKKGWYKLGPGDDNKGAIDLMKKALEIDPGYAEAYARLAYLFLFFDVSFQGDKSISLEDPMPLVQKALDLDPELGHAYMTLGAIHFWKEWDFLKAEKAYKRAVELDPKNSFSYILYSGFLIKMGRAVEAIPYRERAFALDPTSTNALASLAEAYFFSANYENATETLMEFESLFPNQYSGSVGQTHLYLGNLEKAIKILESRLERSVIPRYISCLAIAYAKNGQDQKALDLVDQLKQMSREKAAGSPEYFTALFYSGTGQKEEALLWLEKAYDSHDTELTWLKVDPMFKPIHDDPRYQELLRNGGVSGVSKSVSRTAAFGRKRPVTNL